MDLMTFLGLILICEFIHGILQIALYKNMSSNYFRKKHQLEDGSLVCCIDNLFYATFACNVFLEYR